MTTICELKASENNLRPTKNKVPIKIHSPKTRLRLEDAKNNFEKSQITSVQYNFMPPSLVEHYEELKWKQRQIEENRGYLHDEPVNRNKICVMKNVMFNNHKESDYQPISRCLGEESYSNKLKGRGILQIVGDQKNKECFDEVTHIRCPSNEAFENLEKGRGSRMMNVLQHSKDFHDPTPVNRIRAEEAHDNYNKNQGGFMASLLNNTKRFPSAEIAREPRCPTAESQQNWQSNRGSMMSQLLRRDNNKSDNTDEIHSKKKVVDADGNEINPQNSGLVGSLLSTQYNKFTEPTRAPRVRLDGEEIAVKNQGQMSSILCNQGPKPEIPTYVPRVRPEAQSTFDSSHGAVTKNLLTKYGTLPNDPPPKPHISKSSRNIAYISRGGAMKDALCPPRQKHSKKRRS